MLLTYPSLGLGNARSSSSDKFDAHRLWTSGSLFLPVWGHMLNSDVREMIDLLESQVNNGGFNQFFFNSSGESAEPILASLKIIGAMATHGIMQRAIGKFPGGVVPTNHASRQSVLASIDPEAELFSSEDNDFYLYDDDLLRLVCEYESRG